MWWSGKKKSICHCKRYKRWEFYPWIGKYSGVGNDNPFSILVRKILLSKKHGHNLKAENYFIWCECLGLWAWETTPQQLWENCSKEAGGEVRLYGILQQKEQAVWKSKIRYQVKKCSILCVGRCKLLDSLNSFLSSAPGNYPSQASTVHELWTSRCPSWI